mgnify:CR=1 FL=1
MLQPNPTMTEIVIPIRVDANELWSNVFGSSGETFSWWRDLTFLEGSWNRVGRAQLTVEDPDGDGDAVLTKVVGIDEVGAAWGEAIRLNLRHCGSSLSDLESFDACAADIVMQIAMLGEVMYG